MRTSVVVLVLLPLASPAFGSGPLLQVDAIYLPNRYYACQIYHEDPVFAYEDGQVWRGESQAYRVEVIDRPVRIKSICADNDQVLYFLYEDGQVWTYGGSFSFSFDASRNGTQVMAMGRWATSQSDWFFAYDDGQVWRYSGGIWQRMEGLERANPKSGLQDLPALQPERAPISRPNPCGDDCRIEFTNPSDGSISALVVDSSGRVVRRLLGGHHPAGDYSIIWDGRGDDDRELPSGVYFTRVETADGLQAGRVVLSR